MAKINTYTLNLTDDGATVVRTALLAKANDVTVKAYDAYGRGDKALGDEYLRDHATLWSAYEALKG